MLPLPERRIAISTLSKKISRPCGRRLKNGRWDRRPSSPLKPSAAAKKTPLTKGDWPTFYGFKVSLRDMSCCANGYRVFNSKLKTENSKLKTTNDQFFSSQPYYFRLSSVYGTIPVRNDISL
ncbi:hypothetical protein SBDP1_1770006 [Syntrophobacter sp. SbD1]|nr:hypothetical protein SBDP1_1770006 [Syntrophobacter sp. SbD1]